MNIRYLLAKLISDKFHYIVIFPWVVVLILIAARLHPLGVVDVIIGAVLWWLLATLLRNERQHREHRRYMAMLDQIAKSGPHGPLIVLFFHHPDMVLRHLFPEGCDRANEHP